MFSNFIKPKSQKELYFKINSSLGLMEYIPYKGVAGIYALFKNGICLYVGQSQNIASRLATHLSGKYESCDYVKVYTVYKQFSNDFEKLNKLDKKRILEENEKYFINYFKPIENIIANYDVGINYDIAFDCFEPQYVGFLIDMPCFNINITEFHISIFNNDGLMDESFVSVLNAAQSYLDDTYGEELQALRQKSITVFKGNKVNLVVESNEVSQ